MPRLSSIYKLPAQQQSPSRCTKAVASQIEESKTALDNVKNTMVEMENEIARLRDHVQTLEAQAVHLKFERSANHMRLDAEERNRNHLRRIARKYSRYSSPTLGIFRDPGNLTALTPIVNQQDEERWFGWVTEELQFATEMREVIKRNSTRASKSAGSKRSRDDGSSGSDDGSSGSDDGASKRLRSQ